MARWDNQVADVGTAPGRVRAARLARGMTQAQLAAAAVVSTVTVSRMEKNADYRPIPATLAAVARALRVRPAWLATGEGETPAVVGDYLEPDELRAA